MEIIPAIDLKNGKCVRLYQGDYSRETIFSEDPLSVALKWESMGATRLHIVDLDGASEGEPKNITIVESIIKKIIIPVQLGGGIRNSETVKKLWAIGVQRVILGTIAIENPALIEELCIKNAGGIIIGIDARDGYVSTRGWLKDTDMTPTRLAIHVKELGARRILYTDINRDGTLTEPAFNAISVLINEVKMPLIAAGGIANISHLKKLEELGVEGAVVGRAIYTGDIDLREALSPGS